MQAMRLWSRYFNFFHLHQFARCSSILNSNISGKYWKIVNFQNQQLSFPFCTFLKDYTQQNETTAEKQATEQPYLANFGTGRRAGNKYIEVLRSVKLDYLLSSGKEKVLLIQMSRSKNGHKWIQLAKRDKLAIHYNQFPKIAVPKDAYLLLKAMDALLSKYMDDEKPPISYKLVKGGRFYDYKLGISQYENFEFYMETITTEANPLHRSENMHIPIRLLPLLRNLMAEMLEEFDGSQQIRSRRIPKWIPENDPIDGIIVKNDNKEEKSIGIKQLNFMVDIEPQQRMIMIELKRSDNGMKFIGISMKSLNDQIKFKHDKIFTNFVNIPVPEDAYPLLNAMCVLDNHCQNQLLYNAIQQNQGTLICHQMVKGIFFDYQLKIHVRRNQQLAFKMETITTDAMPSHKPKYLEGPIPIEVFRWLKNQIAEMLLSDYLQEQQNKL